MKKYMLLSPFILLCLFTHAQRLPRTSAYYAEIKGAFYTNRLVFVPIDSGKYLLEYYTYGGTEFHGEPRRDTFVQMGRVLKSKALTATFDKNILTFNSKDEGSKKFRFRELKPCDSLINITRNWSHREALRQSMKNEEGIKKFLVDTDFILARYCHEDFRVKAEELKQEIEGR